MLGYSVQFLLSRKRVTSVVIIEYLRTYTSIQCRTFNCHFCSVNSPTEPRWFTRALLSLFVFQLATFNEASLVSSRRHYFPLNLICFASRHFARLLKVCLENANFESINMIRSFYNDSAIFFSKRLHELTQSVLIPSLYSFLLCSCSFWG